MKFAPAFSSYFPYRCAPIAVRSMIYRINIGDEIGDGLVGCRPRTHQTVNIGLDELVKIPAPGLEMPRELLIHPDKNRICVRGEDDLDLCLASQAVRKMALPCGWHAVRSAARRHQLEGQATARPENAFLNRAVLPVSRDNRTRVKASS